MSELDDKFAFAQEDVKKLTSKPSNEDLLTLYSTFKQATKGDATGKRPGRLDMVGRAKFDAWAALSGTSSDAAKEKYVATVARLRG
ncbi:acyl-CoA-binding protein [Tsukamurella sp. 8F]|uniref:acyl-CoA-binding protein n=1 Tax=unclassified Tsukamurella TaxID=2633480 RepID=UPI0023B8DFA4|nr:MULTISPECIES: acyl-CoA-binding protein [unclassified Tsukamurella]MDF0530112.1 acyl-CoA-binding protein [Tsukamurella sp. 8J]MDF0586430.1 acyl-CoA-binding protein [Tsukamurella sp. 8F]